MRKRNKLDVSTEAPASKRRNIENDQDDHSSVRSSTSNSISPTNSENDAKTAIRGGKIVRIQLINFMCHSNLEIDFHNRANLLVGRNGSGKSAVLTALVVGLGARASVTNRSTSLKNFIKTGENSATIEITIVNDKSDAFEYDKYGDTITVVRQLLASGPTSYRIKNAKGKIISKEVAELNKILMYHNIQTDNPVFVLNQDDARTFLRDLDPSKNYNFFLKATQIETIINKLNDCRVHHRNSKFRLQCHVKKIELLKNEVDQLKDKYNRLLSLEDTKKKLHQYEVEKLWVKVQNQEEIVEQVKDVISKKTEEKDKLEDKIQNKDTIEEDLKATISEQKEQIDSYSTTLSNELAILNDLKREYTNEKERYELCEKNIQKLGRKIEHLRTEINDLEENIASRTESCTSRINKMREDNQNQIIENESKIEEIKLILNNAKREHDLFIGRKNQLEEQHEDLKGRRKHILDSCSRLENESQRISSSSKDSLAIYGGSMSRFITAIEKAYKKGVFSEMPRGPLGRYIEVDEEKWRGVTENLLGGILRAFIVSSAADRKKLDGIIKTQFPEIKIQILTTKFHHQVYDVSHGQVRPPKGTVLFMDVIRCSDPVVMNCLIDQAGVETILLTENQSLAVHLTANEENVPSKLSKIILLKPLLEYLPAPMYCTYSMNPRQPQLIQVDMKQRKNQLEREISLLKEERLRYEEQLRAIGAELAEIYSRAGQIRESMTKHEKERGDIALKLEELKSVEFPTEEEDEILAKELEELKEKLRNYTKLNEEKNAEYLQCQQLKMEKEKSLIKQTKKLASVKQELVRLRAEYDNSKVELSAFLNNTTYCQNALNDLNHQLQILMRDQNEELKKLENLIETAEETGPKVISQMSIDQLDELITKTKCTIKFTKSTESIESVKMILDYKSTDLDRHKLQEKTFSMIISELEKALKQRFLTIKRLKEYMALRIDYRFREILHIRGYSGYVEVDNKDESLNLFIVPRDKGQKGAVSNTRSLSGGERSYSTLAFLLALWSCVEHPFYFLDEYDVFTDQVNRAIMTELLLNEAKNKPHRQYTFLTPQDISFVEASDTVKIHKLSDPKG